MKKTKLRKSSHQASRNRRTSLLHSFLSPKLFLALFLLLTLGIVMVFINNPQILQGNAQYNANAPSLNIQTVDTLSNTQNKLIVTLQTKNLAALDAAKKTTVYINCPFTQSSAKKYEGYAIMKETTKADWKRVSNSLFAYQYTCILPANSEAVWTRTKESISAYVKVYYNALNTPTYKLSASKEVKIASALPSGSCAIQDACLSGVSCIVRTNDLNTAKNAYQNKGICGVAEDKWVGTRSLPYPFATNRLGIKYHYYFNCKVDKLISPAKYASDGKLIQQERWENNSFPTKWKIENLVSDQRNHFPEELCNESEMKKRNPTIGLKFTVKGKVGVEIFAKDRKTSVIEYSPEIVDSWEIGYEFPAVKSSPTPSLKSYK